MTHETKHTPGEWQVHDGNNGIIYVTSLFAGQTDICDLYHKDSEGVIHTKDNAKANARLIAAAPELLESLESFVQAVENYDSLESAYESAKYAIAKAKGE